jgi:hypothetical protein
MKARMLSILLLVGILLVTASLFAALAKSHLPGNNKDYRPEQPIAYSHRLHAGELAIPCLYCHSGAETSRTAGIPSGSVCMNCHEFVTAPLGAIREEEAAAEREGRKPETLVSAEIKKLLVAMDPTSKDQAVEWARIHKLPDFVAFDHRPHVTAGVACQSCHGPIERMDRVRQHADLSMGWCVQCHRSSGGTRIAGRPVQPSLDCATCHY